MFSMLSIMFRHKLKPINSMFHSRPKCLRSHVVNVLLNPRLQFSYICTRTIEHNILKIIPQLKGTWSKIRKSWRPCCWKMKTANSIISNRPVARWGLGWAMPDLESFLLVLASLIRSNILQIFEFLFSKPSSIFSNFQHRKNDKLALPFERKEVSGISEHLGS